MAHFLEPPERELLEALADAILPGERSVGAVAGGAIEYLDRFLAAFDAPVPDLFRGGPHSGREPCPDPRTGEPTDRHPENHFEEVLAPTRLQRLAFRMLLYGSDAVPGGDVNDAVLGPRPGLRRLYREGLTRLAAGAAERGAASFVDLDPEARLELFGETDARFREAFLTHVAEGMFGPPEYGGNPGGVVWRDYGYDGDSQPLGHTLFDRETGSLRDRPDRPNQVLDPRRANDGLEPDVEERVAAIVAAIGGKRFF